MKRDAEMASTDLNTKLKILEDAGYRYSFDRDLYLNPKDKKAFSIEFIEDNDEQEIAKRIREDTSQSEWLFFFVKKLSPDDKRELSRVLGG
jgi:hypothetical protein